VHQGDLLADLPRARNTDPATSHKAAATIKASGALGKQQRAVLELVRLWPGHTSAEIAVLYAQQQGDSTRWREVRPLVARRLPELVPVYIRKGAARICDFCGSPSVTWWPR
jgi:hypothetical protein